MRDEDKWPAIHAFRKAVAHGDAESIRCPDCSDELVPVVGADGYPSLKCFYCRAVFVPGLNVWSQIEDSIRELNRTVRLDDKEL